MSNHSEQYPDMQYKLLAVSKYTGAIGVNIGDYIQALASSQYYPRIDGFLDRDKELKDYDGESCKIIMNGWYMHNPENWPPSDKICPLFVAFHLNSMAKDKLLSPESINYLKRHEPIGCRDINSMNLLKAHGVTAYFSGCMTLTLGKKYHSDIKDDCIYIVDPICNSALNSFNIIKAFIEFIKFPGDILRLYRTKELYIHRGHNFFKKFAKTALYHLEYAKIFGRKLIMEAKYVTQESNYFLTGFNSDEDRLKEAEKLVKFYSKAKLVITSRIHCALPCLGLETPVIYLEKAKDIEANICRMSGLRELFNIIRVDNGILKPEFKLPQNMEANPPANKTSWKQLAKNLDSRCTEFISKKNI